MKSSALIAVSSILLLSASSIFAAAPRAVDQLALQAPKQEAAIAPEPKEGEVAVVITEKGQPVRTIYFEADKGNPWVDAIFGGGGNNGNNNGNNGWNNGGYGGYGRVNCVASDMGWEEHWGGHGAGPSEIRACQQCLSIHGDCRYNCSMDQFRCTAQFTPAAQPGQPQAPSSTYPGDLRQDEGSARDSATLRCMQSTQGQQGYCSIQACNRESQVVNSGRCRK